MSKNATSTNGLRRFLGAGTFPAMLMAAELSEGALEGPRASALLLSWSLLFFLFAGFAAACRVSSGTLGWFAVVSTLLLFPALLVSTGFTQSHFYIALPLLPLVGAMLAPTRERMITTLAAGAVFWAIMLSMLDGSPRHEILFDVLVVVAAGAVAFLGARQVVESQAERDRESESALQAMRHAAESDRNQTMLAGLATLGQIAAGVAHEVNNPLAFIQANLLFLKKEHDAGAAGRGELDEIGDVMSETLDGVRRIGQIVRDLKGLANPSGETAQVDPRQVLMSSVRMATANVMPRARMVVDSGELPIVSCNPGRLAQVFLNLIINAAQAIPEGKPALNEVRVAARADGQFVRIEVSDSGTGMTDEVRANLFRPFFTTKPPGVGTGLGLSICRRILDEVGGRISVESKVGHGSTFRVDLPIVQPNDRGEFTAALRSARSPIAEDLPGGSEEREEPRRDIAGAVGRKGHDRAGAGRRPPRSGCFVE